MTASMRAARSVRALLVSLIAAVCLSAASAAPAAAAKPDCTGGGVPDSKISVQLWTFADETDFLSDPVATENVLRRLSEMGYRYVEPFGDLDVATWSQWLDEYGLKIRSRHVDVGTPENPADIEAIIEENRLLGVKYFGSGSTPIFPLQYTTEAEWIAYAEYLDELGAAARQAGQTLIVHNHHTEFLETFGDRTVFDILVQHTDPRNVAFQLDLYWAVEGGADPVELLERYGDRIELFHVKDRASDGDIEIVGRGTIDFPEIFAASRGPVRFYVVEHDPRFGDPTFDPFEAAQVGFEYLDCVTY